MKDILGFILVLIVYLFIQSLILAIFTSLGWDIFLTKLFNFQIKYIHWVGILFIVKILRLDLAQAITTFITIINNENEPIKKI